MRVLQFLPDLVFGDAVSNDCLFLDRVLKAAGHDTHIIIERVDDRYLKRVRRFERADDGVRSNHHAHDEPSNQEAVEVWPRSDLRSDDLVVFHYSTWSATAEWLLERRPDQLVVVYHNITPPAFFGDTSRGTADRNRRALAALADLAAIARLGVAKSEFSEHELQQAGFAKTAIVPLPVEVSENEPYDERCLRAWRRPGTVLLSVGRIAPNKRIEDLIHVLAAYRYHVGEAWLLLVGPQDTAPPYRRWLDRLIQHLGLDAHVAFAGHVERTALLAYYRAADAYLCMSEHEGFCVPLVEAMALGIPVCAYDSTAIPSTLGPAGLLVKRKSPEKVAIAIGAMLSDRKLRDRMIATGRARAAVFAPDAVGRQFLHAVEAALPVRPAQ